MTWLTVSEAARELGVTERSVRNYCRRKILTAKRENIPGMIANGGWVWLIKKDSVDELKKKKGSGKLRKAAESCGNFSIPPKNNDLTPLTRPAEQRPEQGQVIVYNGDKGEVRTLSRNGSHLPTKVRSPDKPLIYSLLDGSDRWLTVDEVRTLLGISKRAIQKNCARGKYVTQIIENKGVKKYLILKSSLIPYLAHRAKENSAKMAESPAFEKETDPRPAAWDDLLKLYQLAWQNAPKRTAAKRRFLEAYNRGRWPAILALLGPLSFATLERKRKQWEAAGRNPAALAPKPRPKRARARLAAEHKSILLKARIGAMGLKTKKM